MTHRPCGSCFVLVLVVLLAAAVSVEAGPPVPSLILAHGHILPMTSETAAVSAIAILSDRILALGTDEEILALAAPETEIVDLAGKAALPGFIDAHAHLLRDCGDAGLSIVEAQELALSYGVTTAAEMVVEPGDVERYAALALDGAIRVRARLFLAYNGLCGDVHGDWFNAYVPFAEVAPRLTACGVKVFVERSSCGTRRPAISFSDEVRARLSPAGTFWYGEDRPLFSVDDLAAIIADAASAGFPVAMHAIGDAAIETALRALIAAGEPAPSLRPLLLHDLFVRDDLLPLFAAAGAAAVVEPVNACFVDAYDDMLPPDLAPIVRRWGDLAIAVPRIAAGSDWPWGDPGSLSPLFRLSNLVSRANASPAYTSWEPCAPLSEGQIVSVWRGLRMMTADAAAALHAEADLGTLEPGKLADLVVLSANPLSAPLPALAEIEVAMTIVGGRVAWSAEPAAASAP